MVALRDAPASARSRRHTRNLATRPIAVVRQGVEPEIVLDISRLLSRVKFSAPTGVDRVEMAYALRLLEIIPERLSFAAVHPCGLYGRLSSRAVAAFLADTVRAWRGDGPPIGRLARAVGRIAPLLRLFPRPTHEPIAARFRPRVYLLVSPHHLDRPKLVRQILLRERARFACLVHDLIPVEFPEYAKPEGAARHRRRMQTITDLADGVITASEATRTSFLAHQRGRGRSIAIKVAFLGAERLASLAATAGPRVTGPYFVFVATIEPRKNHLLLLNLWRQLTEEFGKDAVPKLVLIGRRGWENENVLDMLDRSPGLKGVVEEYGHLPDEQMWALVEGARALLMPSFAEGFGLPVIEALLLGVPVVCSDIAAHREIAGAVAEFLDPLDGPGWKRAILDYAAPESRRRQDQIRRLGRWTAPTWEAHVDAALELIDEISQ